MTGAPPGWAENPSSAAQRLPLVLWAAAGFAIALYLALYQWRLIPDVWEPFFGEGSLKVLNSPVSHILPIPDAALGALGYFFDAVTGAIGGRQRWRTMPWMVLLFGLAAGPMGLVGILLVVLQPILVNNWCTLCLVSAAISVGIMSPSVDEALASLQYLKAEKRRGRSWWRAFWGRGGPASASPVSQGKPVFGWHQLGPAAAGLWLLAAPVALGYSGNGQMNDWILGPIIISFAVMALWEFMRSLRWVNVALGLWIIGSAVILHEGAAPRINAGITGVVVIAFSLVQGTQRRELFGGGWKSLKK